MKSMQELLELICFKERFKDRLRQEAKQRLEEVRRPGPHEHRFAGNGSR